MKKLIYLGTILCLLLATILSGCSSSGPSDPTVVFEDHFNYTVASLWTPINNWHITGSPAWDIVSGGVTGNALRLHSTITGNYSHLYNDYSGLNYTISVRIKPDPDSAAHNPQHSIFARNSSGSSFNCYYLFISNDGTGATISLSKTYNNGANSATLSSGYIYSPTNTKLDSTKFYTLTFTLNGNSLSGTVTDGTVTKTITYTDDGSTYGTVLPAGTIGIDEYSGASGSGTATLYDDFVVTTP
jgi:hypothetical protein